MKRTKQITDEIEIKWKHVPTKMNHADAGSRGASYRQLEKMSWWNGPYWLVNQSSWPDQENRSTREKRNQRQESPQNTLLQLQGLILLVPFTLKKGNKKLEAILLSSLVQHPGQFILQLPKLCKEKSLLTNQMSL